MTNVTADPPPVEDTDVSGQAPAPSLGEATRLWSAIGFMSFGGPAAQIALMHREIVEKRRWMDEKTFLNALSYCMFLPGPEAMQLATYAGWRLHGTIGGLIAGLLFVLPGAAIILALAALYVEFGELQAVQSLFLGVKAAVLVIVLEALLRVARRALTRREHWVIAALAFLALFVLALPYPLVIVLTALWGGLRGSRDASPPGGSGAAAPSSPAASLGRTSRTALTWLAVWWGPILLVGLLLPGHVLGDIGRFFSVLATVTFGGAYAVLAYMAQEAVGGYGWLTAAEMADALGLAETTPGPLILVTEFVGYLAAARAGAGAPSFWMGMAGAALTLWATFAPCFLWVFVGAPYIDRIQGMPRLRNALAAITAAVVGVILNLSLWFALTVAFTDVGRRDLGVFRPWLPDPTTFDWRVPLLALVAGVLLLRMHRSVLLTLAVSALLGIALRTFA